MRASESAVHAEKLFLRGFHVFQLNALTENTAVKPTASRLPCSKPLASGTSKDLPVLWGTFRSHIGGILCSGVGPPSTPRCWRGMQAMRARPEVRDGLIAFKIGRWKTIALNPSAFGGYSVTQARKNYWRLCSQYPEIMNRLGLSATSVVQ
jgi:hypothetical protein